MKKLLLEQMLAEKAVLTFGTKVIGCKKCHPIFFEGKGEESTSFGHTGAGTQRRKCSNCKTIYTLPRFKNIEALKSVLTSIVANVEIKKAVQLTALPARLYYFYLNQLAIILGNYARLNEQNKLYTQRLVTHTFGNVVPFSHGRGVYNLMTAEAKSGYILLQSNNLTAEMVENEFVYRAVKSTLPVDNKSPENIQKTLENRYDQTMKRHHFESLLVGELKPIKNSTYVFPRTAVNVHFQLLKVFTLHSEQYAHYIEHESCLRSAALVNALSDIKKGNAEIYYYYPFTSDDKAQRLTAQKIGWWNDRWFSNEFGAYCSITNPKNTRGDLRLTERDCVYSYFEYVSENMKKGINSYSVINNLFEIHRVLFNYTMLKNNTTRAVLAELTHELFSAEALLYEALRTVEN